MKKKSIASKIIFTAIVISTFQSCLANETIGNDEAVFFPWVPRATLGGFAGDHQVLTADALLPIYGNRQTIFFLDAQAKTAFATDWLGSMGAGFRKIIDDQRIVGAYAFLDRNTADHHNLFWFINPGFEMLGKVWDLRVNGYLPVNSQRQWVGSGFADDFGDYDDVNFQGHTQTDNVINEWETVGWGMDAEIGRRITALPGLRVYLGGYQFHPEDGSAVNGVSGRLTYPINAHLAVNLHDNYDHVQHNAFLLGLSVSIGGIDPSQIHQNEQPIEQRLLDPVNRHLATAAQGTGEPIGVQRQVLEYGVVERDNVWFFQPEGGDSFVDKNSCTAEQPCSGFNQEAINGINAIADPHPLFYFKPGNYTAWQVDASNDLSTPITLTDDDFYGRSADYKRPQQSAVFAGGMVLSGDDGLHSLLLLNSEAQPQITGLTLLPGSQVTLQHTQVGAVDGTGSYLTAITMQDSALYVVDHSQINAYSTTSAPAVGIYGFGQTTQIEVTDSAIAVNAMGRHGNFAATGIEAIGLSANHVLLANSDIQVNAQATGKLQSSDVSAQGIVVRGDQNEVTLSGHSKITAVVKDDESGTLTVDGISAYTEGGKNIISLTDDSAIEAGLYYDGVGSLNSDNTSGIFAIAWGGDNVISLADRSRVTTTVEVGDASMGDNDIVAYGILTSGLNNTVTLSDHAVVNVNASIFGGEANVLTEEGIAALQGHNYLSLSDESLVEVNADLKNQARDNFVFASGIAANGNNLIELNDQSSVLVDVMLNDSTGYNNVSAQGLRLGGISTVNLDRNSMITVNAFANGDDSSVQAYGIDSFWSRLVINNADATWSNVDASAEAPNGTAVAKKVNI